MLTFDGVTKQFGAIRAVSDLTLSIEAGEVFGLLGPNGAGKSTTIGMAVGLLPPDAGTVRIAGVGDPSRSAARRVIGVAPQALAIYEELTADENLAFFGRLYGLHGADLATRTDAILERIGLSDRRRSRVKTFSGGMKRRLNLGIALIHDPPLLLLDEPTVGVDPQSRNAIFDLIESLSDDGRTIIYTTHYMEEAQRLCDRVGIIDHGRLLALATVDELIETYGGAAVVITQRAGGEERRETAEPLVEIRRALEQTDVLGLRVERPDLESVFLSLTGRSLRD
ncbi:MAG: ABC transporter ATP-binding protein [Phycisphaerales bacterium]|nr:ABC transporter ATP-binding protein [Phycisphaerales bacterium]